MNSEYIQLLFLLFAVSCDEGFSYY